MNDEYNFMKYFPYDPYTIQEEFMKDIENAVNSRKIFLAEAPTGFGKTLALLSAVLGTKNRLFYFTRTHNQMRQIIDEVKKINEHGHKIRAVVKGSRELLCLRKDVRASSYTKGAEICLSNIRRKYDGRKLVEMRKVEGFIAGDMFEQLPAESLWCDFEGQKIRIPQTIPEDVPIVAGPEELRKYGEENGICPYYLARLLAQKYDVVISAYNYLLTGNEQFKNSVVVLDEGHNIEGFFQDELSFQIDRIDVTSAISEIREVKNPHLSELYSALVKLENFFDDVLFDDGQILDRNEILQALGTFEMQMPDIERLGGAWYDILEVHRLLVEKLQKAILLEQTAVYKIYMFFNALLHTEEKYYSGIWRAIDSLKILEWRCLDPRLGFNRLMSQDPHSVIITSGTLSPLESTANRLGAYKPLTKAYPTVIPRENILLLSIAEGPNKVPLSTKFEYRDNTKIIKEYGRTIQKVIKHIPFGTLVFFPSYDLMWKFLRVWSDTGILDDFKIPTYVEQPKKDVKYIEEFKKKADKEQAILVAVARGTVSEGQNFPDRLGRAVIIIGLPYPNITDPRVVAQINYFENKRRGLGNEWYMDQAFSALNQSLGRVWRHKKDIAVGILLDARYQTSRNIARISPWLRERLAVINPGTPFEIVTHALDEFFEGYWV